MNVFLFLITSLIWGSTWLAIKFQLGVVDPLLSILDRFALSVVILFAFCLATRRRLAFDAKDHLYLLITGCLMFGFNYWLVYVAETALPSGLVAITFTTTIFFNCVNNRLFLRAPIAPRILLGGIVGIGGLGLIFFRELSSFSFTDQSLPAILFCLLGALSASFGNTSAQVCQRRGVPVIQMELFAMGYGSILMLILAIFTDAAFAFEGTLRYTVSLFYLAVAGSFIAFFAYLTLLKNIGSDKAAYVTLVCPLIALSISTVYEGYTWSGTAVAGVGLILAGNTIALRKARPR
jgi:drug/metabolite transporter (DMT)-like permease